MVDYNGFVVVDSRDPNRTPMQWDDTLSAGFSSIADTWLPVNPNYLELNVKAQSGAPLTHLEIYKRVASLRVEPSMVYGDYFPKIISQKVFTYVRELKNEDLFVVVINFGVNEETVDLTSFINLPDLLQVEVVTSKTPHKIGESLSTENFKLPGADAMVLRGLKSWAIAKAQYSTVLIIGISIWAMMDNVL